MTARHPRSRRLAAAAGISAVALALGACSSAAGAADGEESREITIAAVPGWDDGNAVTELWHAVLEDEGYDVTIEYVDIATTFLGLSAGDYDLYLGSWLPVTHEDYLAQFGDDIETVGVWNSDARNVIAVNADAPVDSLADLAAHADAFGNRIVGTEAGAGLTRLTQDEVIPTYGLEGMEFITSSSAAMLAELDGAMVSGEDIAVTLWQPHWAYGEYDLKNLEDPEGAFGDAEEITILARTGLAEDLPEVQGWLSDFTMDLDRLSGLQAALFVDNPSGEYEERIATWIEGNRDWVDGLTA
ncbi:glycine betaine ABC transporter substrate-binding protein [Cellulomonas triticagri]|uniref:Glycine betaine ABC transporter substrate-binding protein n=1 Tax=Cellulomonas triticagri TaxID=2483352 RepID=A0A3M2JTH6_9CELL|nr:glycine betaine ABC transporter substrate-binding protein [Cellulomonas triticagri]RMI14055.1 glycine betaine ABC transporter substrate-binding protein [Cellulomonas triticagri]